MANKKFEEIMEYVVNGDTAKAEALFHEAIVDMSREIYENMFDEEMKDVSIEEEAKDEDEDEEDMDESASSDEDDEEMDEAVGGDAADDMMQDVEAGDEEGDESGEEEEGDESGPASKSDVMDLEAELADLKAKFEKLMSQEAGEPHHADMGNDEMDMGNDEMDMDMDKKDEMMPAFEEEIDEIDLSPAALMREYVDKVGEAYKGGKVASSSETGSPNTKSIVAGKNDMGGTTANIAKGGVGSEKGTAGGLLNPSTKPQDGGNVNVPGAKSATKLHSVSKGHGAEKKGSGEQADNKKSIIGSK